MAAFDTVIRHGTADVGIRGGRIVAVGEKLADADEVVDAAASIGDLCGFVPSIKFEGAASRNTP